MKKLIKIVETVFILILGGAFYGIGISFIEYSRTNDPNDLVQDVFGTCFLALSVVMVSKVFENAKAS